MEEHLHRYLMLHLIEQPLLMFVDLEDALDEDCELIGDLLDHL